MSDPKARKVIIVENLLMSTRVKEMIVRVLFESLQVGLMIHSMIQCGAFLFVEY